MKKLWTIALSILLIFSLLTACSGGQQDSTSKVDSSNNEQKNVEKNENGESASNETQGEPGESKLFDEPVTLTMMIQSHPSWPYQDDWYIKEAIEERTNVKLEVNAIISSNFAEKVSLDMASGELPDLTYLVGTASAQRYGVDGAYVNVLDYINEMPNFKKWKEANEIEVMPYLAADGALYQVPNYGIGETNRRCYMYRKDIFDKHGLEVPKDEKELYDVLKKLKELYPDTYPFTFRAQLGQFAMIGPSWGTNWGVYYNTDKNEWVYAAVEDNFKEMVIYFNKLYNEGLIPPDWLSLDTKGWQDIIATEKAFVTLDYISRIDFFNNMVRETNPEFTLAYMPPPKGGENGVNKMAYSAENIAGFAIASNSDKKVEALKFCDWYFTDEARELVSWGEEGKTYKVENGERKYLVGNDVAEVRKAYGLGTYGFYLLFDFDAHMVTFSDELKEAIVEDRKYDLPLLPKVSFTQEELDVIQSVGVNIDTHIQENISKFLLGSRPISEWEQYVKEVEDLGMQQILDIYTEAYNRLAN